MLPGGRELARSEQSAVDVGEGGKDGAEAVAQ